MNKRVLIAYATYAGSTQEVAVEIGKTLGERGFAVDVIPVLKNRRWMHMPMCSSAARYTAVAG